MSNEAPAVVESNHVAEANAPTPPMVSQPPIPEDKLAEMATEAAKARVIACERDVRAVLAKHKCELDCFPVAECGADGITRHRAVVRIVTA